MSHFLSCDWGTSRFRLRCVDAGAARVIAHVENRAGVVQVHRDWQAYGGDRESFYMRVLQEAIAELFSMLPQDLTCERVVISGMASSTLGITELPYASLPFRLTAEDVVHREIRLPFRKNMTCMLVSGVRSENDVMRGEETELIGLRQHVEEHASSIIILPGTHSKHAFVQERVLNGFRTFMTGELFSTLCEHSILRASVRPGKWEDRHEPAFSEGVTGSADSPLLAELFSVRTRTVLRHEDPESNYWYLSGLLIGSELATLRQYDDRYIVLAASPDFRPFYEKALSVLGLRAHVLEDGSAEEAIVRGQLTMLRRLIL